MTTPETAKKPGTGLISAGLFIAAIAIFIALLAINSTGSTGAFVWATLTVGLTLAIAGFAKRLLAAIESR